jgi:hypothetical protein
MLLNYQLATQLVASRLALSSIELGGQFLWRQLTWHWSESALHRMLPSLLFNCNVRMWLGGRNRLPVQELVHVSRSQGVVIRLLE